MCKKSEIPKVDYKDHMHSLYINHGYKTLFQLNKEAMGQSDTPDKYVDVLWKTITKDGTDKYMHLTRLMKSITKQLNKDELFEGSLMEETFTDFLVESVLHHEGFSAKRAAGHTFKETAIKQNVERLSPFVWEEYREKIGDKKAEAHLQ